MRNGYLSTINKLDGETQEIFLKADSKKLMPLDTCLKFAPLALLFALDAINVNRKNNFKSDLSHVCAAEIMLNTVVLPLKHFVQRERPNGDLSSFPSGHTATSFLGSELLYQELKETHPNLSYTGYVLSFCTAVLRLYHKKHWLSDVFVGALIGVASAKLSKRLWDIASSSDV